MLPHREAGTRHLPKPTWRAPASNKATGANFATASTCMQQPSPDMLTNSNSDARRRERARHLVQQGELSAARQALTAGPTAPGTAATLAQLQDPQRRPPDPYQQLPHDLLQYQPAAPLRLPGEKLITALRKSKKGSAPGPSGLTALKPHESCWTMRTPQPAS